MHVFFHTLSSPCCPQGVYWKVGSCIGRFKSKGCVRGKADSTVEASIPQSRVLWVYFSPFKNKKYIFFLFFFLFLFFFTPYGGPSLLFYFAAVSNEPTTLWNFFVTSSVAPFSAFFFFFFFFFLFTCSFFFLFLFSMREGKDGWC